MSAQTTLENTAAIAREHGGGTGLGCVVNTPAPVIRVTIANIRPWQLAAEVQAAQLSATVFESWGAGAWGVEKGATAEFAGTSTSSVRSFAEALMRTRGEQAVYVTRNGTDARLWYADGREEMLR